MRRIARVAGAAWFVMLSSAALQACTHHSPRTAAEHAATYITVRNNSPSAYQLSFEQNNRHIEAGNVDALGTVRIEVPGEMSYPGSHVVLIAVPTTSGRTLREPFAANPGADIRIILGS